MASPERPSTLRVLAALSMAAYSRPDLRAELAEAARRVQAPQRAALQGAAVRRVRAMGHEPATKHAVEGGGRGGTKS